MKYNFDDIRDKGLLLFEYIRGSHAYGLNIETSDIDTGGVYCMPEEILKGMEMYKTGQIQDIKSDNVWYEIGRFIELLCSGNPTMLESLFIPERCILFESPFFKKLRDNRKLFVTKQCFNAFIGYSTQQIEKARGLNKKIVNPVDERKDILDFCYTFKGQGTTPFKEWMKNRGLNTKYCGLVHLPNMDNMYGVYYDWGNHILNECKISDIGEYQIEDVLLDYAIEYFDIPDRETAFNFLIEKIKPIGYRGAMDENNDTTQLRLSSVEKNIEPICIISYNENGFKTHCRQYKEYQEWVKKRNPQRYLENKEKDYDRKNMMHCVRLLNMGIEIAKTGEVNVDRTNIDRDFLLNIRLGNATYDDLIEHATKKREELKEAINDCTLPENVDLEKVNNLLIEIRNDIYKNV